MSRHRRDIDIDKEIRAGRAMVILADGEAARHGLTEYWCSRLVWHFRPGDEFTIDREDPPSAPCTIIVDKPRRLRGEALRGRIVFMPGAGTADPQE